MRHAQYVFVCSSMIPSMKSGLYKVNTVLKKKRLKIEKIVGDVHEAKCECAAG